MRALSVNDDRSSFRRSRRIRRRLIFSALAVLAVAAGATIRLVGFGEDAGPRPDTSPSAPVAPSLETMLLGITETNGTGIRLADLVVFAVDPSGSIGFVVEVPVGTLGVSPAAGMGTLAGQFLDGGVASLDAAARNLLGIRIDAVRLLDAIELGRALDAAGPVTIEIPTDVLEDGEVAFAAGASQMDAAEAITYLGFAGLGAPAIASQHHLAFWRGVIDLGVATLSPAIGDGFGPAAEAALLALAGATTVLGDAIPLTDDQLDRLAYRALADRLQDVWLTAVAPSDRPLVSIAGSVAGLAFAFPLLADLGIEIARATHQAPADETTIIVHDAQLGSGIVGALGAGTVRVQDEALPGIDAQIELGPEIG